MTSNEDLARNTLITTEEKRYAAFVASILAFTQRAGLARTKFTDPPVDWDLLLRPGGKGGV